MATCMCCPVHRLIITDGKLQNVKQRDLNHIDRNIVSLIQELVSQCQRVFSRAAGATGRSARITVGPKAFDERVVNTRANPKIRERTSIKDNNGVIISSAPVPVAKLIRIFIVERTLLAAFGDTFTKLGRPKFL